MTRERVRLWITDDSQPVTLTYICPYNSILVSFKLAFTVRPTTAEDFQVTKEGTAIPAASTVVLLAGDPATDEIDDFVNTDRFELVQDDEVRFSFPNTDAVEVHAEMILERT
jgi:hypothetical protein